MDFLLNKWFKHQKSDCLSRSAGTHKRFELQQELWLSISVFASNLEEHLQFIRNGLGSLPVAQQLLWILTHIFGGLNSSLPHDQLYSLLGMVDAISLPAVLRPDYRLQYHEVFRAHFCYLIQYTGNLSLLHCAVGCGQLPNQPSWVPDFRDVRRDDMNPVLPVSPSIFRRIPEHLHGFKAWLGIEQFIGLFLFLRLIYLPYCGFDISLIDRLICLMPAKYVVFTASTASRILLRRWKPADRRGSEAVSSTSSLLGTASWCQCTFGTGHFILEVP